MASPAAAAWMARTISSCSAPFSRYPRAPARMAANTESSSSNIVKTITAGASGLAVIVGRVLLNHVKLSMLHYVGATVCLLMAGWTLWELIG